MFPVVLNVLNASDQTKINAINVLLQQKITQSICSNSLKKITLDALTHALMDSIMILKIHNALNVLLNVLHVKDLKKVIAFLALPINF